MRATKQLSVNGRPIESGEKVIAPILGQRGRSNCLLQQTPIVLLPKEKAIHFGDGDSFAVLRNQFERVSLTHFAFLLHRKVKSAASAPQESLNHVLPLKLSRQLVTRHPRLANHHDCGTNTKAVAHMKFLFSKTLRRKIFAERAL